MTTLQEKFSDKYYERKIMQNDIYIIDYPFNTELLYQEYLNAKKYFIPYRDHRGSADWWKIAKWNFEYAEELTELFNINANPRFYFLGKNQHLPKHKDNGTECAINIVLNDNITSGVTYGSSTYHYRAALLNTQNEHEVFNGPEDRYLFKLSIFDEPFEEVKNKIESVLEKCKNSQ